MKPPKNEIPTNMGKVFSENFRKTLDIFLEAEVRAHEEAGHDPNEVRRLLREALLEVANGYPADPKIHWTVSCRKRRADPLEGCSVIDDFGFARDFAETLVLEHGFYESRLVNSKGVEVWNSRKEGIRKPRGKGVLP